MNLLKPLVLIGLAAIVSGCAKGDDKSYDAGVDKKHLSQLKAGIWVDPEGCDHWIIDDGVEGYLTQRVDDYGKPICSGAAPANTTVGPFKRGSDFFDPRPELVTG
ncbi:hypothetical protein [Albirhodobacter sp. R86504]|jgi:hypothetical protein|uniref:hypothetical protein n=1 Tax=Albirhodobacter sp. R86504 TaxID=3093848 RepID=UPI0036701F20